MEVSKAVPSVRVVGTVVTREVERYDNVPFLRSPYNYNRDLASRAAGVETGEVTLTQQAFKDEADINTIVKRFGLTGKLPQTLAIPMSGDFSEAGDFHSAMNLLNESRSEFMKLPADLRARFANDPGRLIAFLEDDKNRDEAVKLGLVNSRPVPERTAVQAIDELASKLVK